MSLIRRKLVPSAKSAALFDLSHDVASTSRNNKNSKAHRKLIESS